MTHYTHSRRAFIQGSVGALALGALAACSNGDSKDSGSNKPAAKGADFTGEGPISWVQGKDFSGGMVQKRIDEWNKKYPKEKVTLIELSSEADQQRQSFINAAQTNSAAYDVIGLDLVWVAEFAANRWIVEIPQDMKPEGVIDSVWETGSYRGKQFAVPYATDASIMYYRKDFLEKAKVEVPKTWEDVKKATEAVRKLPGMQDIGGFGGQWAKYEGLTCNISEFINTCGGAIVDDSGKVTVDSPESIKGIQTAVDAFKSKLIPTAALEWKEEDSRNGFESGKVLFLALPVRQRHEGTRTRQVRRRPAALHRRQGLHADPGRPQLRHHLQLQEQGHGPQVRQVVDQPGVRAVQPREAVQRTDLRRVVHQGRERQEAPVPADPEGLSGQRQGPSACRRLR